MERTQNPTLSPSSLELCGSLGQKAMMSMVDNRQPPFLQLGKDPCPF
jgi:hypothetical protein